MRQECLRGASNNSLDRFETICNYNNMFFLHTCTGELFVQRNLLIQIL